MNMENKKLTKNEEEVLVQLVEYCKPDENKKIFDVPMLANIAELTNKQTEDSLKSLENKQLIKSENRIRGSNEIEVRMGKDGYRIGTALL